MEEDSSSDANPREVSSRHPPNEEEQTGEETPRNVLQGLLSRLGGFSDSFAPNPTIGRGKINTLLEGIKNMADEGVQLQCLMELCDYLSIGTEETMANFPIDPFVGALNNLLNMEHNPDIMLLACRALAYMLEALPSSGATIVAHEVVPMLCAKLLTIEYIDLAEQALQCLEKLSHEHPTSIMRAGGLTAVLSFLDFFPIGTQRIALNTAANMCRHIPQECYPMAVDNIPNLSNLLQYEDSKLVEKAVICFARLAECFYGNKELLQKLSANGLLSHLIRLISITPSNISTATYTLALRLITTLCSGTPELAREILGGDIGSVLLQALVGSSSEPGARNVSTEQLNEILSLINELLPPLPKDIATFMPSRLSVSGSLSRSRTLQRPSEPSSESTEKKRESSSSGAEEEEDEEEESDEEEEEKELLAEKTDAAPPASADSDPRLEIVMSNPNLLSNLGASLFPVLLQLYSATINTVLRYKCLTSLTKLLYFSTADVLKTLLKTLSVSSFIANLLSSSDDLIISTALKMCEILMQKLPQIFALYFKREGVFYEIQQLSMREKPPPTEAPVEGETKENSENEIKEWIIEHSQQLLKKYFPNQDKDDDISSELKEMKRISEVLKSRLVSQLPTSQDEEIFVALSTVISGKEGVSTFEFMQSAVTPTLLRYLTVPTWDFSGTLNQKEESILIERARIFTKVFLQPVPSPDGPPEPPPSFLILIHKLHHTLNKVEKFPVHLNEIPGTAAGLKYLTQPFKLVIDEEGKEKEKEEETIVLIEPLATVGALENYIKEKFKREEEEKSEKDKNEKDTIAMEDEDDKEAESIEEKGEKEEKKEKKETSLRVLIKSGGVEWKERGASLLQSLMPIARAASQSSENTPFAVHRMWERLYKVTYSMVPEESQESSPAKEPPPPVLWEPWAQVLHSPPPSPPLESNLESLPPLLLLRLLHHLNSLWSSLLPSQLPKHSLISPPEWVNSKVTAKEMRQLQDPLTLCSGVLPSRSQRLFLSFPFLTPFETRRLAWTIGSLGIARSLLASQQLFSSSGIRGSDLRVGRIPRQKVRVARDRILPSAVQVMKLYGSSRAVLEIEFFGEVGTGLGPSLEFFSLASQALQRRSLSLAGGRTLWRDSKTPKEGEEFVFAPFGLFPAPIDPRDSSESVQKVIQLFHFAGTFVAKALLDQRLVDLPFATPFLKWMRGHSLIFADLEGVDKDLYTQLYKMWELCQAKRHVEEKENLSPEETASALASLTLGGSSIEDLELDFTFPGHPTWELKPQGASESVTIHSLEEYLRLLVDAHLRSGVDRQLEAFREGFSSVLPFSSISLFSSDELVSLMCGNDDTPWDLQTLLDNTKCEHGYTHQSKTVQYLLELMTEMDAKERRQFLLFVTGSPRLPLGGFKGLEPKLTIVRRDPDQNDPNSYLPSVNCCFYYLKLPEYQDKETLKEKLNFAIQHGQGSFSFN